MKTITCDRCGNLIEDGAYREVTTNVRHNIPDASGVVTVTAEYRPIITHQLCPYCSILFDCAYDNFVSQFVANKEPGD